MAQPLLTRLKRSGAHLDILAPDWVAPVLRRMPEVSEVIPGAFRHGALQLAERWRVGRELKTRGYDSAIVLPNSWKSALVPFLAGIPRRAGYIGELRYGLHYMFSDDNTFEDNTFRDGVAGDGVGELERPHLEVTPLEIEETKQRFGISSPYFVLCPGAEYGPAKRWPYFKELAGRLGAAVAARARDLRERGLEVAIECRGWDAAREPEREQKRKRIVAEALAEHNAQIHHVPLHRQVIPCAMRANVRVVHRADNWVETKWVHVD